MLTWWGPGVVGRRCCAKRRGRQKGHSLRTRRRGRRGPPHQAASLGCGSPKTLSNSSSCNKSSSTATTKYRTWRVNTWTIQKHLLSTHLNFLTIDWASRRHSLLQVLGYLPLSDPDNQSWYLVISIILLTWVVGARVLHLLVQRQGQSRKKRADKKLRILRSFHWWWPFLSKP